MSYDETIQYLFNLQFHGIQPGLDRIRSLLSLLGDPHLRFPSVHIGGTNGKGSTSAMVAAMLQQAGYRVGLYTSPHLIDFSERITINGIPIPKEEVVRMTDQLKTVIDAAKIRITFFEFITAMAFCFFAEAVDIAVVEVGLGGRFDATNVLMPLVTAITQIDFDHERYLGATILEIAKEKAGIIKEKTSVITGAKQTEVLALFEEVAASHHAPLFQLGRDMTVSGNSPDSLLYRGISERIISCPLLGKHQMDNAGVALRIIEALQPAHCAATLDPFPVSENDILEGMRRVKWPGRLQMIQTDPMILLDGAHNQAGAHALANYLQGVDPSRLGKHFVMIGILREKNIRQMLSLIAPWADEIVLTRPDIERAADPSELYALLEEPIPTTVQKTVADAISYVEARLKPNDTLVITGSLYTVGEALAYLKGVTLSPIRG